MYSNETTHYGIPKPSGTDLTVPMDYNEAADAVDQALFDASTNATEAVTAANNAVEAAAEAVEDVGDLGAEVNSLKGRTSALEGTEIIQNNKIDNLENQGVTKFDSAGIADPYVNGLTYSVDDVVTYNGQRYICTTAVVAAEPFDADKWTAEDVETVLDGLKSDLTSNEFGTPVNIAEYTATDFTAPSDGYVYITAAQSSTVTVQINGALNLSMVGTDTNGGTNNCFIRKGMTIRVISTTGTIVAGFIPLI